MLEGCRDGEALDSLEEFKNVNFVKLLGTDSELIEEALVDMCCSLVQMRPSSRILLELSLTLLSHKLQVSAL